MKLATWNVAMPLSARRRAAIRTYLDAQQADVWVLTETHEALTPGYAFSHSSANGCDGTSHKEQHWVTIWSRYPLERLETSDRERTAAVRVTPDSGDCFVIYGTVLPWRGSAWRGHPSREGVAFREALAVQTADWRQIMVDFSEDELFVIGDLNQAMAGPPHYYGSLANRAKLEAALSEAKLVALTAGTGDPVRRDSPPCACIDHICARRDSSWRARTAVRWPKAAVPPPALSDHFGISILFDRDSIRS